MCASVCSVKWEYGLLPLVIRNQRMPVSRGDLCPRARGVSATGSWHRQHCLLGPEVSTHFPNHPAHPSCSECRYKAIIWAKLDPCAQKTFYPVQIHYLFAPNLIWKKPRRNRSNPLTILRGNIKKVVKNRRNVCPRNLLQHWYPLFTSILWHLEKSITDFKIFLNFRFLVFSSYHKNYEKYEPSLRRSGKYGQEAYGTKHFREVYPDKWIADKVSHC